MAFDKSIILKVVDRSKNTLKGVNRRLKVSAKLTALQARNAKVTDRAFKNLARAANSVSRAVSSMARRSAIAMSDMSRRAARVAKTLAKISGAGAVAALTFGTGVVTRGITSSDREARAAGVDRSAYTRLIRYLELSSNGGLDREGAVDLFREFRNRITGESFLNKEGAAYEALGIAGDRLGEKGLRDSILALKDPIEQFGVLLDAMTRLRRKGIDTQFLSEEFVGGQGTFLSEMAALTDNQIQQIRRVLDNTAIVYSDADVENAQKYRLAIEELQGTLRALLSKVITPLLPAITSVVDGVSASVKAFVDDDVQNKIRDAMKDISDAFTGFVDNVASVASDLRGVLQSLGLLTPETGPISSSDPSKTLAPRTKEENERALAEAQAKIEKLQGFNELQKFLAGDLTGEILTLKGIVGELSAKLGKDNPYFGEMFLGDSKATPNDNNLTLTPEIDTSAVNAYLQSLKDGEAASQTRNDADANLAATTSYAAAAMANLTDRINQLVAQPLAAPKAAPDLGVEATP